MNNSLLNISKEKAIKKEGCKPTDEEKIGKYN